MFILYRSIRKTTALQAFCMRFLPQDPNHFYIGTDSVSTTICNILAAYQRSLSRNDMGLVVHCDRQ